MWRFTIISNMLLIFLFWIASVITITPAYNHFVRYGDPGVTVPTLTGYAISARFYACIIPMGWALFSFFIYKCMAVKSAPSRHESLLAFTAVTLVIGFFMLAFFGLACILPYLKIGAGLG